MAPHGEALISSYVCSGVVHNLSKPTSRLSSDGLKRTVSDMSFDHLSKEAIINDVTNSLTTIPEVEDAKCECCGMVEECTHEYIDKIRGRFSGKWICGLCSEAVKEEMAKNGGDREEALSTHMNTCFRFNRIGRAYPVLCQAEAMREILKKTRVRAKSLSPRDHKFSAKKSGIARSSSCIPAITREINDFTLAN